MSPDEHLYQSALDALTLQVAVVDANGTIVAVNKSWTNFSENNGGNPVTSGVGMNYLDVCARASGVWSEGAPEIHQGIAEVIRGERPDFDAEYPCLSWEGERWFLLRATPLADPRPGRTVVAHIDITERKKAQQDTTQLITNARCLLWQAFVEDRNGIIEWDIQYPHADVAHGFLPIDLSLGKDFAESLLFARDPKQSSEMVARSDNALRSGYSGYQQEFKVRLSSGSWRWLNEDAKIERLGPAKWRVTGVCTDITERKQVEEALQLSDSRFTGAFEHSSIGMALVGLDGRWMRVNNALCDLLGYPAEELTNLTFTDVTHPEDRQQDRQSLDLLLTGKIKHYNVSKRYVRKDGSLAWVLIGVSFIPDNEGRPLCFATQIQDITPLKNAELALLKANDELELRVEERTKELTESIRRLNTARAEAEAANRAKGEFLSRMSHELRTPLNAILGFGQLLELRNDSPFQSESVAQILGAGRHLLNLINDVLDITKVDSGLLELSLETVDLYEAASEACELIGPLASDRKISLKTVFSPAPCLFVKADRQRLRQVLINLLSNAIKYNHDGGSVEVRCSIGPNGRAQTAVRDWGAGLRQEDVPKLFTPFERLGAINKSIEGTGLGLVLCRQLVIAMSGTIGAESKEGEGSTFWFELESVENPDCFCPVSDDSAEAENPTPVPQLVLCIEDNVSNLRLLEAIFSSRSDLKMISAVQGSVGIDLATQHLPKVILLDLHLPDISGGEVLARLRSQKETAYIPVIITSADANAFQIRQLKGEGANEYLTKPLNIRDLLWTIDKFLGEGIPTEEKI